MGLTTSPKPKRTMAVRSRQAARALQKMGAAARIQILVRANLMTQDDADKAIKKLEDVGR